MDNTRITKVYLLNVPLESDYKHTLYFNSESGQHSYFESKVVKSYTTFSYQRKDNIIRIPDHFDDVLKCNYVMYQNTAYSNKWFYAFIKDIKYISDGRTDIEIETDVIQTWMFDYTVKPSFVEREHVDNDTIGVNTYPESLETGEYICNTHTVDDSLGETNVVISFSDSHLKQYDNVGIIFDGIYNPMGYYAYPKSAIGSLNELITKYDEAGKGDAICSVFMAPEFVTGKLDGAVCLAPRNTPTSKDKSVSKISTLNGYTPRNKKLLTYPFCYLLVDNNAGATAVYKQELFSNASNTFKLYGALSPGCSIRLIPTNYNGIAENDSEGINLGKYAVCAWINDVYTNWVTQNSVNLAVSYTSGLASLIGGVATKSVGGVVSGALSIGDTIGQQYAQKLQPDQARGNTNCGDVMTGTGKNAFNFYNMSIKKEYAEIIDGYFDMFGYKVCKVKQPNIHHRSRYWYTKTIDVNIDGAIPNKDMQRIKDCYNNGITFWRNANEIQDYSLSNEIKNIV